MAKFILAIDQGTTSTRALLFDLQGQVAHVAQKELPLITPQSGWVEQDATRIWQDVVAVCRDVLGRVDINDVACIGITNQRETTVLWDRETGKPVYNAIVWQDRRTAEFCNQLRRDEDDIQNRTGLLADPYFSGTKIRWILDHIHSDGDGLAFGTIDSFLLWNLTNGRVHSTDISNASRTMLVNIRNGEWDDVMCDRLNIPRGILPNITDNTGLLGETDAALFGKSLPVMAMVGDQQSATFGQACFDKGQVKSTYGTGCFALMNTGATYKKSDNRLLSTIAWRINGQTTYALEGAIFVAGAAIQFLRDNLEFFAAAPDSEKLAQSVNDTDGVVFVPAFTGLGAPYWEPDARGAILGLSRGTTQAHITRAVLEAQAYQTRDLMTAMRADTGLDIPSIRVDGGLVNNDFVCGLIADQIGCAVERPVNTEATSWGAAAMAGLQAGIFAGITDIQNIYRLDHAFKPDDTAEKEADQKYDLWLKAVSLIREF